MAVDLEKLDGGEGSAFTAHDRCDACGAQATTRAFKLAGDDISELMFCNHHRASVEPKMLAEGWEFA